MKTLKAPFTKSAIQAFRVGDRVLLSGTLLTGRDAVHKYLYEGNPSPVNLANQIIYHCGPVVTEEGGTYTVKAAGPTTSMREEPYQWKLIEEHGLVGVIGKGGMGQRTQRANKEHGCVYFHAIGGAAQVLAETITKVTGVYLKEMFGSPEAIWELVVKDFPVVVTMDAHGESLHEDIEKQSREALKKFL